MAQEEQLARAASEAKDQFIATLSHELRTPLTPILFALKAAEQRRGLPSWLAPTFDLIRHNVEQEARLIDDLLDVTRISRGKLTLAREPVDAHAILDEVASQCTDEMRAAGLALTREFGASAHHVHADPTRLRQVFWNLLNNARQHTPSGGRISLRSSNDAEGALVVVVADNGEGIEPTLLTRLFAPYAQAPAKGKRPAGLGLGLAICKAIVEAHGGRIWAHSEGPARGAALNVRLPTLPAPERKASRPSAKPATAPAPKTVLLVEDDKHTAAAIAEVLRLSGYEVKRARTISEALQQAGEGFDVLVCDIGLPDGNGRDLIRELCASRPVRAIALTGYGMDPDVRGNLDAGFVRHLTKPIDPEELLAAVGELLETPQPVPASGV
jgi:CheY-like chemotaxis protein